MPVRQHGAKRPLACNLAVEQLIGPNDPETLPLEFGDHSRQQTVVAERTIADAGKKLGCAPVRTQRKQRRAPDATRENQFGDIVFAEQGKARSRGADVRLHVPPDRIGLRQISFGPSKGLQKQLVRPGYRRAISGYETIHTFPRNVQAIEFTNDESERGSDHRTFAAVNVPTVDGYPVAVDCTVLYRIADPFLVVSKFGFGRGYEDNVVIRFTDPALKQRLGELRAEEFYRDQRLAKVHDIKRDLAQRFRENGLELADILIRQYDYPQTFQQLTEQKKIQDQSVLTNRALAKQAEVDTRLKQTAAEGQNSINVRSAEFQAQITGLNAPM